MPPRNKKVVNETEENAVETVETPVEPINEQETDIASETDSVVERVVSKVKQVITLKKVLTDKQQAHLDKLAKARLGKKTTYRVIPVVEVPLKPKAKRTVKPKVILPASVPEPITAVRKPRPKKVEIIQDQEPINLSKFNKNLF